MLTKKIGRDSGNKDNKYQYGPQIIIRVHEGIDKKVVSDQ